MGGYIGIRVDGLGSELLKGNYTGEDYRCILKLSYVKLWVLPPLSNSWRIIIIGLYLALNRTPNIDFYWGGEGQYPT